MAVTWEYRDGLLVFSERGVTSNAEIEQAAFREALADARARPAMRVLWDARQSETPVSGEDIAWRVRTLSSLGARGVLSRFALLVRGGPSLTADLGRKEIAKAVQPLQYSAFSEESEAVTWLHEGTSRE